MDRIALLDDDEEFRDFVSTLLAGRGYRVAAFATAGRFLDGLLKARFDLFVIDVRLPGMDGRELVRVLKRNDETRRSPVIVVSGQAKQPSEVVRGLEEGADEYLAKPFGAELFVQRVVSLIARSRDGEPAPKPLEVGGLVLSWAARAARLDGRELKLTRLEFDVLEFLLRNPGRVMSRGVLLQEVWKDADASDTRTVDKHVETLRKKLGAFGRAIETVVGLGYVFRPERTA